MIRVFGGGIKSRKLSRGSTSSQMGMYKHHICDALLHGYGTNDTLCCVQQAVMSPDATHSNEWGHVATTCNGAVVWALQVKQVVRR